MALMRIDNGWAVTSGGMTIARFRGPGSKRRALRFVADHAQQVYRR